MIQIIVAVIAATIPAIASIITVVITSRTTAKKSALDLEKAQAVTDTKIVELTREVREHNNFARRMPVVEEKIADLARRVGDLEDEI